MLAVDPTSPFACLFYVAPIDPHAPAYDRNSPFADARDPECRACQEPHRYDDHTCPS
jgi:hypothetical protein